MSDIAVEPLDLDRDAVRLHAWVTHPKATFWGMRDASIADVLDAYEAIDAAPHHEAFLGRVGGEPSFLVERYDPAHSELADHDDLRPGDVGMHVLVAPTDSPRTGFTTVVFTAVMEFLFADPACRRVVVEPDVRNDRIAALNAAAGFEVTGEIRLSDKTAALSFCTRDRFDRRRRGAA